MPDRLLEDPLSLVRLDVLFIARSGSATGVRNKLGFAWIGDATVLCGGDIMVLRDSDLAGGFSEMTFVALSFERSSPSNST